MKFVRTVLFACSAALAIPTMAMAAQDAPVDPAPRTKPAPLTQDQWNAKISDNFKAADSKKDGKLTLDEYRAHMKREEERRKTEREAAMFKRMDANNDGVVTEAEFKDAAFKHNHRRGDRFNRSGHKGMMMKDGSGRMGPPPAAPAAPAE